MNKSAIIYLEEENYEKCLESLPKLARDILICLEELEKPVQQICSEIIADSPSVSVYLKRLCPLFTAAVDGYWYVSNQPLAKYLAQLPPAKITKEEIEKKIETAVISAVGDIFDALEKKMLISNSSQLVPMAANAVRNLVMENWNDD